MNSEKSVPPFLIKKSRANMKHVSATYVHICARKVWECNLCAMFVCVNMVRCVWLCRVRNMVWLCHSQRAFRRSSQAPIFFAIACADAFASPGLLALNVFLPKPFPLHTTLSFAHTFRHCETPLTSSPLMALQELKSVAAPFLEHTGP